MLSTGARLAFEVLKMCLLFLSYVPAVWNEFMKCLSQGFVQGWLEAATPTSAKQISRPSRKEGHQKAVEQVGETEMSEAKPSRPASKRLSTVPAAPKPPANIDPSVIIANHATLAGVFPITIGPQAVLHPYAKVVAVAGPVEIGEGTVIAERAVIGINDEGSGKDDEDAGLGGRFVMLERDCIIESGAQVAAKLVGEGTFIDAFAVVGEGCVIGKFCKILPHARIAPNTVIEDFTIVYGQNKRRKDTTAISDPMILELRKAAHRKQLKTLQMLIPSNLAKWTT
ncbi:uncharacterized protein PV09_06316 [Verruconis gallopava]|uniref:Dynactin subunit 6 n=1 Tax=Verruconis gallopava TaxID=253628 RepID=A0A0D2A732_9PEZI|nr:uncharacterized protein PV09_06316 [Verruconis gallopava]KIW02518.1 hypothetical protein PV09_06316 [Verruconis gallopava]